MVIEPLDPTCIQPASMDVHLDKKLLVFKTCRHPFYIDVKRNMDDPCEFVELDKKEFSNEGC
jgi:deoxycytidine triphosphate deaminase